MGFVRLDDHYSNNAENERGRSFHDTIAAERTAKEVDTTWEQAAAIRPKLTDKNEIAMLDRLVELVRGDNAGTLSDLARDIGVNQRRCVQDRKKIA